MTLIQLFREIASIFIETAKESQAAMVLLMGGLGYVNAKRTYWNSMAPIIVPESIDFKNHTFHIKNIGRGPAHDIQFSNYNHLIDWFDRLLEWRLEFKNPAALGPNAETDLTAISFEDGKETKSSDMLFWSLFPPKQTSPFGKEKKKKQMPLTIEFENVEGITYITTAVVENGEIKRVKVRRDYLLQKMGRFIYHKFQYHRIRLTWRIQKLFSRVAQKRAPNNALEPTLSTHKPGGQRGSA